jgi:hypothetical protein
MPEHAQVSQRKIAQRYEHRKSESDNAYSKRQFIGPENDSAIEKDLKSGRKDFGTYQALLSKLETGIRESKKAGKWSYESSEYAKEAESYLQALEKKKQRLGDIPLDKQKQYEHIRNDLKNLKSRIGHSA